MNTGTFRVQLLFCLFFIGGLGSAAAQNFDISSGGTPTITGALGGSITGSSNVLNNLVVTVNFGELSPANTNGIVKVVVPVAIRSNRAYRVTVSIIAGSTSANPQAIQASDVGFGVNNLRSMGSNAQVCTNSSHIFYSPFNNDPANNVTINAIGRAAYPSTLNNVGLGTVILSGPRLSATPPVPRQINNGRIFDAIFAVTPQFYAAGTSTATLAFTISAGPAAPC